MEIAKEDLRPSPDRPPKSEEAKKSISNFKLREGMPIGVRNAARREDVCSWKLHHHRCPASATFRVLTEL
jgi:ribosomal protein L5